MRKDYLLDAAVLRLATTKKAKRDLQTIRDRFFPSFSEGTVVRILAGIYFRKHKLRLSAVTIDTALAAIEAAEEGECVEIYECDEGDIRIFGTIVKHIKRERNSRYRATSFLKTLVSEF